MGGRGLLQGMTPKYIMTQKTRGTDSVQAALPVVLGEKYYSFLYICIFMLLETRNRDTCFSFLSHENIMLIQSNCNEKRHRKLEVYFWVYLGAMKAHIQIIVQAA